MNTPLVTETGATISNVTAISPDRHVEDFEVKHFKTRGVFVSMNTGVGVLVQKTGSVVFSDASGTITGNSIGIFCAPTGSGYVAPSGPGTVIANRGTDILNCAS